MISDLLPAYLSGEATADTRALVDEMAARDPEIARLVRSACGNGTMTFWFDDGGITFWLFRDERGSCLLWLSAIYLWFDYVRQGRRLRVAQ